MRLVVRLLALMAALIGPNEAASAAPTPAAPVGHVFIIVLENKGFPHTFGAGQVSAPYLTKQLPAQGALMPQYYGIGHSSAPNYIAMISGQPPTPKSKDDCGDPLTSVGGAATADGIALGDGCVYPGNFLTIGDQLTQRGLTWKGYMEGIQGNCSLKSGSTADPNYRRKHNPFVFFMSLRDSGQCAADDVPLTQLPGDLATASHTPNYAYIVPNQCNDAHDSCASDDPDGLKRADAFLKEWVPRILNSPAFRSDGLLIVTFDEADADSTSCCGEQPGPAAPQPGSEGPIPGPGGGATGAVLVSPFIKPGTVTANAYNHYSLLRSVEDFFGVAHLAFASPAGPAPFGTDVFTNPHAAGGSASSGAGSGSGASGTGPRPACRASSQPQTRFSSRRRTTRRRIELRGGALELGCSEPGGRPAVRVVLLSVARRVGRRCRFLRADGTATTARSCGRPLELLARGARSWRVLLKGRFAAGRYVARVRAIDVDGHRERTTSARNELRFTVG